MKHKRKRDIMLKKEPNIAKNYFTLTNSVTRNKESTWHEAEQMKAYWHEAGHAVIARLTGFHVAWVSVDRKFIEKNPLAMENGCNHSEAVCMTQSSERINPILAKRKVLNKEEKETIMGYCMHVLAGPYVEQRFDPESFNPNPSANDYGQAGQFLAMATPSNKAMRKKLHDTARRRLEKMLDQNWHLITHVAYALFQRHTITSNELDEIIDSVELKEAA
jgi:hypothetical protein